MQKEFGTNSNQLNGAKFDGSDLRNVALVVWYFFQLFVRTSKYSLLGSDVLYLVFPRHSLEIPIRENHQYCL